ncbi:MAG: CotH kinase family protein [Lachnospiraceae bacterium]|nr:CotH kinase family protein [Lachnospiraceae bacterium]
MNSSTGRRHIGRVVTTVTALAILTAALFLLAGCENKPSNSSVSTTPAPTSSTATPTPDNTNPDDPTPTPKGGDYTGDKIEFTNDMPDLVFSRSETFGREDVTLRLYSRFDGTIYYTLDGTHPTEQSNRYDHSQGILLTANMGNIPKVWSIRAAAFYDDGTKSDEFVRTYILGSHVSDRYETMVFAINGDPAELYEEPDGIFTEENYENRGRASERAIYMEILTADGTMITSQNCGIRVYGAYSHRNSQKSMKFYARKSYSPETGTFYLNFLDRTTSDGSATQIVRYDKFVLRASGNDYRFAFIRDELNQVLAADAGFTEYESVAPAVCYINGQYYGFFWVHASYCDEYLKSRYGDSPAKTAAKASGAEEYEEGEFVILEGGDTYKKTEDGDDFNNTWAKTYDTDYYRFAYSDLTDSKLYAELRNWMDVEDYLDYMAYNIYLCNKDWPNNNYKCFRYVPAEGESLGEGVYDGRWRYLLHDIDYTYSLYGQQEVKPTYDTLRMVLTEGNDRYSPLLAALLKRDDCVEYFVKKTQDYANGALSPENIKATLDEMNASRGDEMTYYYNYIASLGAEDADWVNESQFQERMQEITDFADARPARSLSFLKNRFVLGKTFYLTVTGSAGAQLTVNSYRVPAEKSFTGTYFEEYDTTVSADYADGYRFDYWEVNGVKKTSETLRLTESDIANGQIDVVLHVAADPASATVTIDYIAARGNDCIVLRNPSASDVSVAGYTLTDGGVDAVGDDRTYRIPDGTVIPANGTLRIYCVKAATDADTDTDAGAAAVPEGALVCPFKLSKGDTLTLSDASGKKLITVDIPNLHTGFVYRRNIYTGEFREERE